MVDQNAKLTFLVFIRHGERSDYVIQTRDRKGSEYTNDIEHDPALTRLGLQQATGAGQRLTKRLSEVQEQYGVVFDRVTVESSPFLRCL